MKSLKAVLITALLLSFCGKAFAEDYFGLGKISSDLQSSLRSLSSQVQSGVTGLRAGDYGGVASGIRNFALGTAASGLTTLSSLPGLSNVYGLGKSFGSLPSIQPHINGLYSAWSAGGFTGMGRYTMGVGVSGFSKIADLSGMSDLKKIAGFSSTGMADLKKIAEASKVSMAIMKIGGGGVVDAASGFVKDKLGVDYAGVMVGAGQGTFEATAGLARQKGEKFVKETLSGLNNRYNAGLSDLNKLSTAAGGMSQQGMKIYEGAIGAGRGVMDAGVKIAQANIPKLNSWGAPKFNNISNLSTGQSDFMSVLRNDLSNVQSWVSKAIPTEISPISADKVNREDPMKKELLNRDILQTGNVVASLSKINPVSVRNK